MSCLARLSRPKHILDGQEPEPIPTILLRCPPSLKRYLFSGPAARLPVTHVSCVFYDSKHAASVCLGTIHARTHVQLGLSCQQLLLKVPRRLRFTMQHVCSHVENLGNECADHAAALGAFGLVSHHKLSTHWTRHSFDSVSCFDICHNLGDVLEKLRDIRTGRVSASQRQTRSQRFVPRRVSLWFALRVSSSPWSILVHSLGSTFYGLHGRRMCCAMERSDASSVSTASDSVDFVAHNIWNPMT